jgi:hypothetical protein
MRERDGNYVGAVDSGLDSMEFGAEIPSGGSTLERLIGAAVEAIGRQRLWGIIDRLTSDQAAVAAQRMEAITASRQSLTDSLTEEKWAMATQMRELLRNGSTFDIYSGLHSYTPQNSSTPSGLSGLFAPAESDPSHVETPEERRIALREMSRDWRELMTHSKQQIIDANMGTMDNVIAEASLPFASVMPDSFEPHDPFNRDFLRASTDYRDELLHDDATRMDDGLLTLAFALHAYRVKNGIYPDSLDRLIASGLLHSMPTDPFAATVGSPFRYRRLDTARFLLYSVGPDGIDDGGKPVNARTDDGKPRFSLEAGDKGDWVLGRNTPHNLRQP